MPPWTALMPATLTLAFLLCILLQPVHCRHHMADKSAQQLSLRIELVHRDSPQSPLYYPNLTDIERSKRKIERSNARLDHFKNQIGRSKSYTTTLRPGDGEFLMVLGVGTPSLSYVAILDTGSDLTWTQCKPCRMCYKQRTPLYDPTTSSSYRKVPCGSPLCAALPEYSCNAATSECEYVYMYGDYSTTSGMLGYETFTVGSATVPSVAFGCGEDNEGDGFLQADGLAGFGRGALSLVSQMGKTIGSRFSYCLTSVDSKSTSQLLLGGAAPLKGAYVSTPLLRSASNPTFYYVDLEGISVGGARLAIPRGTFDLRSDGSGGCIVDTGTTVTYLEEAAYSAVRTAVMAALRAPLAEATTLALDTCFSMTGKSSAASAPTVTLHFRGGADMALERDKYLMKDSRDVVCLAMLPSSGISILGNFQQQNFHIIYNTAANVLSFSRAECDSL